MEKSFGPPESTTVPASASCCRKRRRQNIQNVILPRCQIRPRENLADRCKAGNGRKYTNLTPSQGCRMKEEYRFPRHFTARYGLPRGRLPLVCQSYERKDSKRTNGFCTQTGLPSRREKPPEAPFPPLSTFPSLQQERNFFQHRNPVLAARKRTTRRRNAPYELFSHLSFL